MEKSYECELAYFRLKKEAAPGVDGETWRHYGEQLEVNLQDLAARLKGAYRAKPVRRVYADQFRAELTERMRKFNLELHPEKTRLLEFGPFAINNRQRRGEGKPETFNFLGFTHICVKKRSNGMYTVLRQTIRMHEPIPELGKWLQAVVRGHVRYYGVPMNQPALFLFRFQVGSLWYRALSRRSQNGRILWDRMRRLITRWLPLPSVCHPYPLRRLGVIT